MNCLLLVAVILTFHHSFCAKKRIIIDHVALSIHGPAHTTHICASDLVRPSLEGHHVSIDDAIDHELVRQDMERFKMTNGDEGKKHIERMKKENNYTDKDITAMFGQTGRSLEDGINEITHLQQYHGMEQMQIHANVFVSDEEIKDYYDHNPLYTEGEYTVRVATVAYKQDKAQQAEHILSQLKQDATQFLWSAPLVIQQHELSEERKIIIQSMKQQAFAGPFVESKGYELFQLVHAVPSSVISLAQRYTTIKTLLEKQKSEVFLNTYHANLRRDAIITLKQHPSSETIT